VLLDLIVKHREKLSGQAKVTSLYQLAADAWLDSRSQDEQVVPRPQRLAFARTLARRLFESGEESATYHQLAHVVLDILGGMKVPSLDRAILEVHKAVFLAHDEAGDGYRFAHKSFMEYFLAIDIAARIDDGRADALDLPRLIKEVAEFLMELDGWEARVT
jgi:predicted NACHT family NTPase